MLKFVICYLMWVGLLRGQVTDPFSPLVSRAESILIQEILVSSEEDPIAAIADLQSEITGKSSAALEFTLGNLYFQVENYGAAVEAYERALKKYPNFRDTKINLGRGYLLLERIGDAIKVYQELVRDGIADAETYVLLGHSFMMEGKSVSAETAYRQSLLLNEDGLEARQGLLNCLLAQNRNAEVLGLTEELIGEDATQQRYWAARANAQLSLGQNGEAARSLEQARRLGVADAEMLSMLGQLYLQEELPEEAVARLEEAFAQGELASARKEQAIRGLIQLSRLEDAERMLSGINGEEEWIYPLKARLEVLRGNLDLAGPILKVGLEKDPLNGELLLLLAEVQQVQGESALARMTLERLSRVGGYEADALIEMARMEVENKDWAASVKLLERAMVFEKQPYLQDYVEQLRRMNDE